MDSRWIDTSRSRQRAVRHFAVLISSVGTIPSWHFYRSLHFLIYFYRFDREVSWSGNLPTWKCPYRLGIVVNQKILIRESWIKFLNWFESSIMSESLPWLFDSRIWFDSWNIKKMIRINFLSLFLKKISKKFKSPILDSDLLQALL